MADRYSEFSSSLESPAGGAFQISPHDADALATATRGIYVGAAGNLSVEMVWGGTVTFAAVPSGSLLPIRVRKVLATGTTAGSLVGVY